MNAQTVGWLVFLALIKNFPCPLQALPKQLPLELVDSHLTAIEGSCIEIKFRVIHELNPDGAYWFWMKNANWSRGLSDFTATIIYSTDNLKKSASPDYADRVKYTCSLPLSSWKTASGSPPQPQCSVLICNLTKTDSGNYSVRFVSESTKWKTKTETNLTVAENPCPITFEKPTVVNENDTITLTCSTLSSCPSNLKIEGLTQLLKPQQTDEKQKSVTVSFTATWQDDGKEFSCQTEENKDTYLIRNISFTVEYAPKETLAKKSPENITVRQFVTLTCSAKGSPHPNFTWFKDNQKQHYSAAEWNFTSIEDSQSGEYHCEAQNKHGTVKSNPVIIDVTYEPQVEVTMTSPATDVTQGDQITLTCNVKKSNPQPTSYAWFKNGAEIGSKQTYVLKIEPEDQGFYRCSATNSVGTGYSNQHNIEVKYGPRDTSILGDKEVKVGNSLTLNCVTDANPAPNTYSWYRYNENEPIDSSHWTYKTTQERSLHLDRVQRADKACYICNATNTIYTGEDSQPFCIEVLYPPTIPTLSMDDEVTDGQLITITCTVESYPQSHLTLTRTSTSNPQSSEWHSTHPYHYWNNILQHTFNVTSTHTGYYTCSATNSEGSNKSAPRKLSVKYCPKDVTIQAEPGLVVNEFMQLTLRCIAQSHPPVTSVTWMKTTDEKSEIISTQTITVKSVSPSDSGLYSCEASNGIGTGKSQKAEVKVKYAPKYTKITKAAEQHRPDGISFVTLSCSSHSYPSIKQYTWYKKIKAKGMEDESVSHNQNYIVYSDQPGEYYCIAQNEINQSKSDSIQLFVDRGLMKALKIFLLCLLSLLIIVFIFFAYRRKRNRSIQQRTMNSSDFLSWWNSAMRRNLMNEPIIAEPFRSRDDLLADQPCRPNAQRRQPRPDNTPASNINSIYCTVNLPAGKQGPPAQKPIRQQGGHTEADSLNYASLHFGNKQTNKHAKAEEDVAYAMVSKQKPPKKNEQDRLEDYENISAAHAAKFPDPLNCDTDTSEDEEDLSYSHVIFKAKPGHQRASSDSSTSDEEETQYSEVKI
ncbi:B-cell receptor CD22 [Siniperca chuatsi]|uniref:B-cell receptor CD22 n=1 Tax=Siniperca chuatsi TaxID=119488 RepID=UPI001CE06B47|nr:B-cell receptor CD22 [Siniperca chuatsi]